MCNGSSNGAYKGYLYHKNKKWFTSFIPGCQYQVEIITIIIIISSDIMHPLFEVVITADKNTTIRQINSCFSNDPGTR